MTETRFGTFQELIDLTPIALRPVAERLRKLVLDVDGEAVEVVRLGDRAATYGVGPKKMKEGYAYILPYDQWVNLGFFHGVDLPDPEKLLEGSGKRMRHVKVRSVEEAAAPELEALVVAALQERQHALGA